MLMLFGAIFFQNLIKYFESVKKNECICYVIFLLILLVKGTKRNVALFPNKRISKQTNCQTNEIWQCAYLTQSDFDLKNRCMNWICCCRQFACVCFLIRTIVLRINLKKYLFFQKLKI